MMNGKLKTFAATGTLVLMSSAFTPATLADENKATTETYQEIQDTLNQAAEQINQMKSDQELSQLMEQAKGVFIVPNYGRAALGVGGAGGEGVLLVNNTDEWSDPLFYNFGAFNIGLEAGAEGGQIAMLLMTDESVNSFLQENNWSLNADSGFTFVNYSARAQASAGKGDIVLWSDTEGAFVDLAINIENIVPDKEEIRAYYGGDVNPNRVAQGQTKGKRTNPLENQMP